MEKRFSLKKLPLETMISLFIELYESGVDFVDFVADNTDPIQDKLVIFTREGYINPEHYNEERLSNLKIEVRGNEDEAEYKLPPIIETKKLSDDDINNLL